jgi:hypothetical protein
LKVFKKASQTPLLSGLRTGVKQATVGSSAANQRDGEVGGLASGVGGTVVGEPLHGLRGTQGIRTPFDAVEHHVADHLPADAAARGANAGHDLAIVGVDGEGDADDLAVPAGDLEAIRGPALVRGRGDDGALVRADGAPAGMGLQEHEAWRMRRKTRL